jgi:hypothetical protein
MTMHCLDTTPMPDFRSLCARLDVQSPYRSTVPLLSLVQYNPREWCSLLSASEAIQDAPVCFEYRVAAPNVGGTPSHTDAVVMSDTTAWAVEAKWTESRYETVTEYFRNNKTVTPPRVIVSSWLEHFKPYTTHELRFDDFQDVVYQVLHRAASACAIATKQKRRPELVYLHFHPSPLKSTATTELYVSDLAKLYDCLGSPAGLTFRVVEMPLYPTPAFEAIKDLNKSSPASSKVVVEALCRGPLFTFGTPVNRQI